MDNKLIHDLTQRKEKELSNLFKKITAVFEKQENMANSDLNSEILNILNDFFERLGIEFLNQLKARAENKGPIKIQKKLGSISKTCYLKLENKESLGQKENCRQALNKLTINYLDLFPIEKRSLITGTLIDGEKIVFIEWDEENNQWTIKNQELNPASIQYLVKLLTNVLRKEVSITLIEKDFGIKSTIAKKSILSLYGKLLNNINHNTQVKNLFDDWKQTFNHLYGSVLENERVVKDFYEVAKTLEIEKEKFRPDYFLFILYTYYAIIVKLIAVEITGIILETAPFSISNLLLSSPNLPGFLRSVENGSFFKKSIGVNNFPDDHYFSWYLEVWDNSLETLFRDILKILANYDSYSYLGSESISRDLLKKLYLSVIPPKIRHDLGEYYTPDWLVELVINETGFNGNSVAKILDPGCGSGSFLVEIINRIKSFSNINSLDLRHKAELLVKILNNVVGFDVNPLAVISAKTNYLLAIFPLLEKDKVQGVVIPVFMTDAILTPELVEEKNNAQFYKIFMDGALFSVPKKILVNHFLELFVEELRTALEKQFSFEKFCASFLQKTKIRLSESEKKELSKIYSTLRTRREKDEDYFWIKTFLNSFIPLKYFNYFDFVVGNPPWVKWEFLSAEFKNKLKNLYLTKYSLYSYQGMKAGLGFAHDDVSILFTYIVIDKYLKNKGILGFILKQTLYKSVAGKEFRKFVIDKKTVKIPLKVLRVHDLKKIRVFETSGAETSVIILRKGERTTYPIEYVVWSLKPNVSNSQVKLTSTLTRVNKIVLRRRKYAYPASWDENDVWVTKENKTIVSPVSGKKLNPYEVRHGVVNDLNSVFFVEIVGKKNNGLITVRNANRLGRKKVEQITRDIEPDLVFPVIKPRHISRWKIRGYYYMIIPQKKAGINNEETLAKKYPETYNYLCFFKKDLLRRSSRWFKGKPFYSLFGIGEYTFAPYKVVWSPMVYPPKFAVASKIEDQLIGNKVIIPDNTIGFIPVNNEEEAYYLSGILNSEIIHKFLSQISSKSKWAVSISAIQKIPIPKYNDKDPIQKELAFLSQEMHELRSNTENNVISTIERKINELAEKIMTIK